MYYRFCGLRPSMIKFMLLLLFFCNVIGWEGAKKFYYSTPPLTKGSKFSPQEELRRKASVENYILSLIASANERRRYGKIYSPYDYFQDLKLISNKEKELEVPQHCNSLLVCQLQNISLQFVGKRHPYSYEDIEKAKNMYPEFKDPAHESRKEVFTHLREMGWGILGWFWLLYLKTLPLVFILYLLWAKEEQDYSEKFLLPKPLRFCLLLITYPFVIGYFIFRGLQVDGRKIYAEAQLRRTKKLFAHISEEEQEKIKAFAKSKLSLSHWKEHLSELGLKPRHCLASALMVTLVFVFVIRPAEASAKSVKSFSGSAATLRQMGSSQNPARMSIDDKKIQPEKSSWTWERGVGDMLAQTYEFVAALSCSSFLHNTFREIINEFIWEIFHIPLSTVGFELKSQITQC